jgi:ribonuclease HI
MFCLASIHASQRKKVINDEPLMIFTDAAYINQLSIGSIAFVVFKCGKEIFHWRVGFDNKNCISELEILAVHYAIRWKNKNMPKNNARIFCDSICAINMIKKRIKNNINKRKCPCSDFADPKIKIEYIRAHQKSDSFEAIGNNLADDLASSYAQCLKKRKLKEIKNK